MKKIKFDISHKDKIVSGQWKVITCHGEPVEIVKWNCMGQYPILACIFDGNTDDSAFYKENGDGMCFPEHNYLITVIDEPEENITNELVLEAISDAINSMKTTEEKKKLYTEKVFKFVENLLKPSEIENYENSKDLTEFEIVVGKACEDAMKNMPSINPAIWAIGRQWTDKILEAAKKQILGEDPIRNAYDLGFHEALQ